jgi:hypothetical protein
VDFTVDKYRSLCKAIVDNGYESLKIVDGVEKAVIPEYAILLRHDVDRKPQNALELAKVEHEYGLGSTYYFRMVPASFNPKIIKEISELGHEIGFHYECLSKTKGDYQEAIMLFAKELEIFRNLADIKTIAMHGSPFSPYNNLDLWKTYQFSEYGIVGEAYLSIDYRKFAYFTDTGRTWERNKHNLRDFVNQDEFVKKPIVSTDDLIDLIENRDIKKLCIQSHPERWAGGVWEWGLSYGTDQFVNLIKSFIRRIRDK